MELETGRKYKIVHKTPGGRSQRYSVLTYLGASIDGSHNFDARPIAGTQTLREDAILEVHEVSRSSPIVLNAKVR